ncbi:MAG TPA: hypothetical protein DD412_03660 [Holosporales bacterium]|nr:hypothetical protein [Holosporales bacterium]
MSSANSLRFVLSLLLFLTFSPLLATESLMFSQKECSDILLKRAQNRLDTLRNKDDCLECNGLIFQGADKWSVWINGQKIDSTCPHCPRQHLKISTVENNKVHLEWIHKGKKHLITLEPNHYYNANLSKVITTCNAP